MAVYEIKHPIAIRAEAAILKYFTGAQAAAAIDLIASADPTIKDEVIVACIAAAQLARKSEEAPELKEVNALVSNYIQSKARVNNGKGNNITLMSLAGHMIIAGEACANIPIVKAMRFRLGTTSIWATDLAKSMLSDQKKAILLDFAKKHPVSDSMIKSMDVAILSTRSAEIVPNVPESDSVPKVKDVTASLITFGV